MVGKKPVSAVLLPTLGFFREVWGREWKVTLWEVERRCSPKVG